MDTFPEILSSVSTTLSILFVVSLLSFWLVGSSFCGVGRIVAAGLLQSVLLTLLIILLLVTKPEPRRAYAFACLFCLLTVPYVLSRCLLRLPRRRAAFSGPLLFLLILLVGSIGYGCF